jgi:hypothetical protein
MNGIKWEFLSALSSISRKMRKKFGVLTWHGICYVIDEAVRLLTEVNLSRDCGCSFAAVPVILVFPNRSSMMKKNFIFVILALCAAGLFAQPAQRPRPRNAPPEQPGRELQTASVSGPLSIINGRIAVQSDGTVFYAAGIQRFVGFIDGLKEGAQVTLDGYVRGLREESAKMLFVTKLTLNGKSYDTVPAGFEQRIFAGHDNDRFGRDTRRQWSHHRAPPCWEGSGRGRTPYRN